jgi:rhodanese-related sulfurtransferase
MKKLIAMTLLLLAGAVQVYAADNQTEAFDRFLTGFNYEIRADMKANSKQLIKMIEEKKAILLDIRFSEEVKVWKMGFGLQIPLNELPKRYKELPKDKIIVTACPHKDRSSLAMAYLRTKGYNARYLTDGLTGLAESLRGDDAKDFREDTGCCP